MSYWTELPFNFKGKFFRSAMPFGIYDREGTLIRKYKENDISVVIVLAEQDECIQKAGRDLLKLYTEMGLNIIHIPTEDYKSPDEGILRESIDQLIDFAIEGRNIAIHCSAGIGRTGTYVACIAKKVFGRCGNDAIKWVREYIPSAIETMDQVSFIDNYIA